MLWSQLDDPSGDQMPVQNFEADADDFDCWAAADFMTWGERWLIDRVTIVGTYLAFSGPVDSVNVSIHYDAGAMPGMLVPGCDFPATVPTGDVDGTLTIDLAPACLVEPGVLWLVVQSNMDFATHGQYYWSLRTDPLNHDGLWANPGGGFQIGCFEWTPAGLCGGYGWDYLFSVEGATLPELWTTLELGPALPMVHAEVRQHQPAVAYNSTDDEYLVVWHEDTSPRRIWGQLVSGDGTPLSSFPVAEPPVDGVSPDVAYDPERNRYFVVFLYDYAGDGSDWDVVGRFIEADGTLRTSFLVEDSSLSQWDAEVAYDPVEDEFLVVYSSAEVGVPSRIEAARVDATDPDGPVLADELPVAAGTEWRSNPDIAYNAALDEYLVVYDVEITAGDDYDIAATRLSAAGVPQGPEIWVEQAVSADRRPVVASCHGRDEYLVVYEMDTTTQEVVAARRIAGGTTGDVLPITGGPGLFGDLAVTCGARNTQYVLAWHEGDGAVPDRIVGGLWTLATDLFEVFTAADTQGLRETALVGLATGAEGTLAAWEQDRGDGANQDVAARIVHPWIFANGFEGGDPMWSDSQS